MAYNMSIAVQVLNSSDNDLPKYETIDSAGCDVRANLNALNEEYLFNSNIQFKEDNYRVLVIHPHGRALIPTGLKVCCPSGYEIQVRPRSGLALKKGITVLNSPGTIDADYRGDIGVILINNGQDPFEVNHGDRIAQLVLNKVEQIEWHEEASLNETDRSEGGFGHSGVK